jgi:hypothetical protein
MPRHRIKIDRVFVHPQAACSDTAARFRRAFPDAEFQRAPDEGELRSTLRAPDRHAVYIGPRSSRFISRFHPPAGMICSPFWKFTSETFCPMGCHYCYLSLTFRIIPYLRIASNLQEGAVQMDRLLGRHARCGHRTMFNIGELGDGRILDPITQLSGHLLPVLDRHPNGMLHVLTKAGADTIGSYLDLAHLAHGRVIHVASVNPQRVVDLTEEDTPAVADRLAALAELQKAGYRIRLRIDPIFDLRYFGHSEREAFGVYDDLVDEIEASCVPELVTLGSYRANPQLIPHIRRRYPSSLVLKVPTHKAGPKRRVAGREAFYRRISKRLRRAFPNVRVALCKETVDAWHKSGLELKPLECSCLPLAAERQLEPTPQRP